MSQSETGVSDSLLIWECSGNLRSGWTGEGARLSTGGIEPIQKILRVLVFETACTPAWHESSGQNYSLRGATCLQPITREVTGLWRGERCGDVTPTIEAALVAAISAHGVSSARDPDWLGSASVRRTHGRRILHPHPRPSRPERAIQCSILNCLGDVFRFKLRNRVEIGNRACHL